MSCWAEFEEKEYENPLNHQLLGSSQNLWPCGQVFEGHFGIDSTLLTFNVKFWDIMGYSYFPGGVILDDLRWGFIWRKIKSKKKLPTFRTNLFLQVKRPQFNNGTNPKYRKNGIKKSYWQFTTTKHQQKILERLSRRLGRRALVTYACSAFHTKNELFQYTTDKSLIENSNFTKVINLSNHHKWVFDKAGTEGLACSEIKYINDDSFHDQILNVLGDNERAVNIENDSLNTLLELERSIIDVCRQELELENAIASEFFKRRKLILNLLREIFEKPDESLRAYITVHVFTVLANLIWKVIG